MRSGLKSDRLCLLQSPVAPLSLLLFLDDLVDIYVCVFSSRRTQAIAATRRASSKIAALGSTRSPTVTPRQAALSSDIAMLVHCVISSRRVDVCT